MKMVDLLRCACDLIPLRSFVTMFFGSKCYKKWKASKKRRYWLVVRHNEGQTEVWVLCSILPHRIFFAFRFSQFWKFKHLQWNVKKLAGWRLSSDTSCTRTIFSRHLPKCDEHAGITPFRFGEKISDFKFLNCEIFALMVLVLVTARQAASGKY